MTRIQQLLHTLCKTLIVFSPVSMAPRLGVMSLPNLFFLSPLVQLGLSHRVVKTKRYEVKLVLLPPVWKPAGILIYFRFFVEEWRCQGAADILPARLRQHL